MADITLQQADLIIDATLARGTELKLRPLAAAVLDVGGNVKAFKKQDGGSLMRFEMAFGKAYASRSLGRASRLILQRAQERPLFMDYLIRASDGKIFPEGGGVLIRSAAGEVIGAIGVTGDTQERDEDCAIVSIDAAGLKTDEP